MNVPYLTAIQSAVYSTALVSPKVWLHKQNLRYQDLLDLDLYSHKNPTSSYAQ